MIRSAGIDVGGTKFLGVVLDEAGEVILDKRRLTPQGGDEVVRQLAEFALELAPYDTLGVGVPGLISRDGVIRASPNLVEADEVAVGPRLGEILGHPVSVDNDATCATLAEWRHGAGRGFDDIVLVTLGTGIGGGLVLGGRLQRREFAEEIVLALVQLSQTKTGALVVVERDIGLRGRTAGVSSAHRGNSFEMSKSIIADTVARRAHSGRGRPRSDGRSNFSLSQPARFAPAS